MPTLDWIGKKKVVNHHLDVPFKVLNKQYTFSADGKAQDSENKIIHGDNLEALKALLPEYEGKIKCIYIDPPYNTGEEKWIYNDNVNDPRIKKWLGEVVGKESEDLNRHDKWLCMMYPRLKMLHKLLSEDGLIFISIDDNEQANLKMICDDIFGASNFEGCIHWRRRNNQPNDKNKLIGLVAEFLFVYAKDSEIYKQSGVGKIGLSGSFSNPDNDPKGEWASKPWKAAKGQGGTVYEITYPDGQKVTETWLGEKNTYEEYVKEGRIYFPLSKNGKLGSPRKKYYKFEREQEGQCANNWWPFELAGCNQDASNMLKLIFNEKVEKVFDTPKPTSLLELILTLGTNEDSIVLDSFAGSGTTAHAVLNMNKADNGNRKFILVEMMDYADSITAERVKRVINGYGDEKTKIEGTLGDFNYYELGEPLLVDGLINEKVDVSNIREYIWFTETHSKLLTNLQTTDNEYFLGKNNDAGYWFYYKQNEETCLNYEFLSTMKTKADQYIIYADVCRLPDSFLKEHNIVFKKIPREIQKF